MKLYEILAPDNIPVVYVLHFNFMHCIFPDVFLQNREEKLSRWIHFLPPL